MKSYVKAYTANNLPLGWDTIRVFTVIMLVTKIRIPSPGDEGITKCPFPRTFS